MKINNIFNFSNFISYNNKKNIQTPKTPKNNINDNKKYLNSLDNNFFSSIKLGFTGAKMPVYLINEKQEYKKFASQKEASDFLGCDYTSISQVLRGHTITIKGYAVKKADEIEKKTKDNKTIVDRKKIENIARSISRSVYVIDKNGEYIKFDSKKQAAKYLGCHAGSLGNIVNYPHYLVKGRAVVSSNEIEKTSRNNKVVVDKKKIAQIAKHIDKSIYVFDAYARFKKFSSRKEIEEFIGCDKNAINQVLSAKTKSVKGYGLIRAADIEIRDENNNIEIDKEKLNILSRGINRAIYIIKDGKYQRFDSQAQAVKSRILSEASISNLVNGRTKAVLGYRIVRARDVEFLNEKGEVVLDEEKLKQILER